MASLTPQKIVLSNINGGQQFANGDVVTPEAINSPIQASAYAQALATNQPDVSEAGNVGTPSVSIVTASDGTPRFKFSNLKGAQGAGGVGGSASNKPVYTHAMQGDASNLYPFEVYINKLTQNGAVVALTAGSQGCYVYAPTVIITYGDTNSTVSLGDFKIVLGVSSRKDEVFLNATASIINDGDNIVVSIGGTGTNDFTGYKDVVFDITINESDKSIYINVSDYKSTYIVD